MLLSAYRAGAVTRLRATSALDSDGDPVESWATPDRLRLRGASVQEVRSEEVEGTAKRVLTDERTLFVPGRADVLAGDRIETGADIWRVNGSPVVRAGLASGVYTSAALTRITSR